MQLPLYTHLPRNIFLTKVVISFFALGSLIDSYLQDHEVTLHYKLLAGLLGTAAILFTAQKMKGILLRRPVRA